MLQLSIKDRVPTEYQAPCIQFNSKAEIHGSCYPNSFSESNFFIAAKLCGPSPIQTCPAQNECLQASVAITAATSGSSIFAFAFSRDVHNSPPLVSSTQCSAHLSPLSTFNLDTCYPCLMLPSPTQLLFALYENVYCSVCKRAAVRQLPACYECECPRGTHTHHHRPLAPSKT